MLFGSVVGVLAKVMMPGRDPGGFIVTILLGIAGALLGGWIGRVLGVSNAGESAGFLMALVGSVLLLALYKVFPRRRTNAI